MESIQSFDVKDKICGSVMEVFDMMLSMELDFQEQVAQQYMYGNRILGSINLVGKVMGIVTLQVSETLARIMTAEMQGVEPDEILSIDEINDVIGEVLNMIGGNLKSNLCDAGLTCSLSTPALTSGKDYILETREMTRNEYFTFYYQDHTILIHVGLKNNDVDAAQEKPAPEPVDTNVGLVISKFPINEPIHDAVIEVFDTMLEITVDTNNTQLNKMPNEKWIVGSVSLSGVVMGRVNIHVSEIFSREMTAAMLGIEPNEIEDFTTVKDCVGEVCNMVSGHFKTYLCDSGMHCQLSPPSFTSGKDFEMDLLKLQRIEKIGFKYQDHKFLIEVGLKHAND
jgi:flagellar motor switch protein FliN/FliY